MSQIESDQLSMGRRDTDDARFLPSTSLGCPTLIRQSPTMTGDRVGVLWPHLRGFTCLARQRKQ